MGLKSLANCRNLKQMKGFKPDTQTEMSEAEKEAVKSLLKYPSLEKVFDPNQPQTVAETKKRLQISLTELERVVRSGTKQDAEKAAQIVAAYQTTINFLDELERLRKNQPKQ